MAQVNISQWWFVGECDKWDFIYRADMQKMWQWWKGVILSHPMASFNPKKRLPQEEGKAQGQKRLKDGCVERINNIFSSSKKIGYRLHPE